MKTNVAAIGEQGLVSVLQSSLYPGASVESIGMVLSYCQAAKLDPMQKPVHIVPMWDSKSGRMRDVILPGVGLYRIQAARTGEYAGVTEPEYGPDVTDTIGGATVTYPQWCKVTVKRIVSGVIAEFTAREFWKENYAVKGGKEKSIAPNAMWSKRPYAQLAKCAESQALRKAFPELCAQPTAEEMEGKSIDGSCVIEQEDDTTDAVSELLACESMADLQVAFGAAWKAHTGKAAREALTKAKDEAKARLMEVDHAAAQ